MAKSQKNQTFVLKINTGYLSRHNWDLTLKLNEIRKQSQLVVSLGSSQVLRWMEKEGNDATATNIKKQIKEKKKLGNSVQNKQDISKLYDQLYITQFQQDYMMLVMDSAKDYRYACSNGFSITVDYGGYQRKVKYKRFLGTAGSIKKSTIIFVNEEIHDWLMNKINNGRYQGPKTDKDGNLLETVKQYNGKDLNYKFIPAKVNAYFALQCSASIAVPWPRVVVVNDVVTKFTTKIREVRDTGGPKPEWPSVTEPMDKEVEYKISDGMGFITPEMSAKWAEMLNEGSEPLSGYNTRCAFLKGMVFTVDFKQFAEEIAGTYEIIDAWGDKRDVRDADVIITTSMLKLWNSYAGYKDYYNNCIKYGYEFCVAKSTPHELRNVHTTNYQYLQDFTLTDEQINELISPTVTKIKECLGLDWRKLILYMCGIGLDEQNVMSMDPMCKSIMANPELINDPYIRSKVSRMIQKRIKQAKIGVLDVEGDYSIAGNDPYSLLQSIFGLKVTGLLKQNECYHKYWSDHKADEICVFRAPMTSIENVCKLKVVTSPEMEKWYKYIKTCILLNSWDTTAIRCNGEDFDSDSNFCTNNKVLLDAFEYKTTLMCVQESMSKKVPTEEDYIKSDINGFGDSIGSVTNKATNMISLREKFAHDSEEYKELTYRISTMMNYQQNAIDRIKGVVARPVPKEWLESRLFKIEDEDSDEVIYQKQINSNIAAEIKPWFFIYRYSHIKSKLDKYVKTCKSNCKIRFGKTLEDLYASDNRSNEEDEFLYYYEKYMPVSRAPGTMNRICFRIEDEFQTTNVLPDVKFDYSILKSKEKYTQEEYDAIAKLYDEYNKNMQFFLKQKNKNDLGDDEIGFDIVRLKNEFVNACSVVCPNEEVLANIVVDICYTSNKNKTFAWDISGEQIFINVLKNNGNVIMYPVKDENGDIEFCGKKFVLHTQQIGGDVDVDFE
nr:MAG TPA: RNA-dependent RNA polymerase [Caudoviricetes sp.]